MIKEGAWKWQPGWPRFLIQIGLANVALAVAILWLQPPVDRWLGAGGLQRATDMGILVVSGVAVYFIVLALAGVRVRHFRHR